MSSELDKFDLLLEHIDEKLYRTGQANELIYFNIMNTYKPIVFIKNNSFQILEFFFNNLHDFDIYKNAFNKIDLNLNFFSFLYFCFLIFFRKLFYFFFQGNSLLIFNLLTIKNLFYVLFFIKFLKPLYYISFCFQFRFSLQSFSRFFLSFFSFLFFEFQFNNVNFYKFNCTLFKKDLIVLPFFFNLIFWIPILSFFKFMHVITYICRVLYNDYINSCCFFSIIRKNLIKTFFTRPSRFRKTVGVYFFSTRIRESFYIDLFFSMYIFYYSKSFIHAFPFSYFIFKNSLHYLKYSRFLNYTFNYKPLLKYFIINFYNFIYLSFEFFDLFFLEYFSFNLFFINSFLFFVKHPRVFILKRIRLFKYLDLFLFFFSNFLFSSKFLFFFFKRLKKQFFNFISNFNFFYKFDLFFYLKNMREIKLYDFFSHITFNFSIFFFNKISLKHSLYALRDFSRLKSYRFRYRTLIKIRLQKRMHFVKKFFSYIFFNYYFKLFNFLNNLNFYIFWNIICFPIVNSFSFFNISLMHFFPFSFYSFFFKNGSLFKFVDQVFTLDSFVFFFNKFSFFINHFKVCKLFFIFFFDYIFFYRLFKYVFYSLCKKNLLNNSIFLKIFFTYKKNYEDIYH